jgi:hypothetical protein
MPFGFVAGAGEIYSGIEGAQASKSAASAQKAGAAAAQTTETNAYNNVNSLESSQRNLGYGANGIIASLYGIGNPNAAGAGNAYPGTNTGGNTGSPTSIVPGAGGGAPGASGAAGTPNYSAFYNSPGYQFTLGQGEQAINRGASASGGLYSTSTLLGLNNYAQGAASTQYGNYVSQLMNLSNMGQNATGATANAATSTANNVASAQLGSANASASGILGAAGAMSSGITGAANSFSGALQNSSLFSSLTPASAAATMQSGVDQVAAWNQANPLPGLN